MTHPGHSSSNDDRMRMGARTKLKDHAFCDGIYGCQCSCLSRGLGNISREPFGILAPALWAVA
jgi:hypothetical protein